MDHVPSTFQAAREACLTRLQSVVDADPRLVALWVFGSLASGTADPLSDIDAVIAVDDAHQDAVYAERQAVLERIGQLLVWSDATTPGLRAVHALLAGPVKLDLYFESATIAGTRPRPPFRMLLDKAGMADQLRGGWEPPRTAIADSISVIIRMTRQGALWPLRLLYRGQWATVAMMEVDLINAQVAQLMAVQRDPAYFYQNPFALSRLLADRQRHELEQLTAAALAALAAWDVAALRTVHLQVYDALVREGRAACAALGMPYPIAAAADVALREVLEGAWPDQLQP